MSTATRQRAGQARVFAVHVDPDVCDGCGICVFFCKPTVFELSREMSVRGVFPARAPHVAACTGCGLCELGCPQLAILVLPVAGPVAEAPAAAEGE